jgi:hypothetical protein
MKFPLVLVIWHDAFAITDTWIEVEDIDDEPCVTHSVGWLLPDAKKDHVVICQSTNSEDTIDSVLAIPVAMVKDTKLLMDY